MKKGLGVALMLALCASSAFALAAPQRVQGLRFGTWTPQGFNAEADTTFINGATQVSDTTEAFNAANADWGAMGYDANGSHPVFRVWISGSFVSVDTAFVSIEQSFDKVNWQATQGAASNGIGCPDEAGHHCPVHLGSRDRSLGFHPERLAHPCCSLRPIHHPRRWQYRCPSGGDDVQGVLSRRA